MEPLEARGAWLMQEQRCHALIKQSVAPSMLHVPLSVALP